MQPLLVLEYDFVLPSYRDIHLPSLTLYYVRVPPCNLCMLAMWNALPKEEGSGYGLGDPDIQHVVMCAVSI